MSKKLQQSQKLKIYNTILDIIKNKKKNSTKKTTFLFIKSNLKLILEQITKAATKFRKI